MAREDPYFRLRIPDSLKKRVEEASQENRRSMTAEIIARLEKSFRTEVLSDEVMDRIVAVEGTLQSIIAQTGLKVDEAVKKSLEGATSIRRVEKEDE